MLLLEVCVAREQQETRIGLETLVPTGDTGSHTVGGRHCLQR